MILSLFPELDEAEYRKAEEAFQILREKLSKDNGYNADEEEFQKAQEQWEKKSDLKSWNVMYMKIQKACFNCINKKLVGIVPNTTVEDYSHEVTLDILSNISKKRQQGKFWKIAKLSAFVHMPCMSIYQKQKEFEDTVKTFSEILREDKTEEDLLNQDFKIKNGYFTKIDENKEFKKQIEKMKLCQNCRFKSYDDMEEPCRTCSGFLGNIKLKGTSDKWGDKRK